MRQALTELAGFVPYEMEQSSYPNDGKGRWLWKNNKGIYGKHSHRQGKSAIICAIMMRQDGNGNRIHAEKLQTAPRERNFTEQYECEEDQRNCDTGTANRREQQTNCGACKRDGKGSFVSKRCKKYQKPSACRYAIILLL